MFHPLAFKLRWLNEKGQETGFLCKRGRFAGLDAANFKALKWDLLCALDGYRSILQRVVHSVGVKHKLGMALWKQVQTEKAAQTVELALEDCGNYVPADHALVHCYQQLGRTAELTALKRRWGVDPADAEPVQSAAP